MNHSAQLDNPKLDQSMEKIRKNIDKIIILDILRLLAI